MTEDKEKDIIKRLLECGFKNYSIHRAEVQDGVLVKVVLMVEDKEVVITR